MARTVLLPGVRADLPETVRSRGADRLIPASGGAGICRFLPGAWVRA
jgi:hypothetical protein